MCLAAINTFPNLYYLAPCKCFFLWKKKTPALGYGRLKALIQCVLCLAEQGVDPGESHLFDSATSQ